jgi:hypothetical protein
VRVRLSTVGKFVVLSDDGKRPDIAVAAIHESRSSKRWPVFHDTSSCFPSVPVSDAGSR